MTLRKFLAYLDATPEGREAWLDVPLGVIVRDPFRNVERTRVLNDWPRREAPRDEYAGALNLECSISAGIRRAKVA